MGKVYHALLRGSASWAAVAPLVAGGMMIPHTAVAAQTATSVRAFQIPESGLEEALLAFADQAGVQIAMRPQELQEMKGRSVQGTFSARDALRRVIGSAPVAATWTNEATVMIRTVRPAQRVVYRVTQPAASSPDIEQVGPEAQQPADRGDIVVTARRREESLQSVPISITAVTGEKLSDRGVRDALDLQYQSPSLTVTGNGPSRTSLVFSIRGQRSNEVQLLSDPAVGSYFAEVVTPRTYGFGTAFYDIQSVQVLKGVQGTLFGRNMTGGAVLIEPNHPDLGEFQAAVTGQYGNYDMKDVYGMVNIPVVRDVFALRVAGKFRDRDGFTKDVSTGRDYDDQHYHAFRVSAELDLGRVKNYTVFDWMREREHGTAVKLAAYTLADPLNGAPTVVARQVGAAAFFPFAAGASTQDLIGIFTSDLALPRRRVNLAGFGSSILDGNQGPSFNRIKNWGVVNRTTFEAGDVTFKNIFGYRNIDYINHVDYDGSGAVLIHPTQFSYSKNLTEEFQMQGTPFGPRFNLTMGGYFFREWGRDGSFPTNFPQITAIGYASGTPALRDYFLGLPGTAYTQSNISRAVARSYAFYAAGTYDLTGEFKLSGGIRYNNDLRKATVNPLLPNLTIPGLGTGFCVYNGLNRFPVDRCAQSRTLKNDAVTWDATLQYEPSQDLTAYVATRKGYRAGGFSLRAQADSNFAPFQPENVQEYEVGLKNRFNLGGGARLNTSLAIYFQDYTNVQKQNALLVGQQVVTLVTNTTAQHNYGGEFEAELSLPGGISANMFYSYVTNKVVEGGNGSYAMQGVPHHQLGGGVSYERQLGEAGRLNANVNATYRSRTPLDDFDAIAVQKGYAIVNARVALSEIAGTGFGFAAFVNNLTDAYYKIGGISLLSNGPVIGGVSPGGGPGYSALTYGEPRMYGFELSYRF